MVIGTGLITFSEAMYRHSANEAVEARRWIGIEAADRGTCGVDEGGGEGEWDCREGFYGRVVDESVGR